MTTASSAYVHPAAEAVAVLGAALDDLAEASLWSLSRAELTDVVAGLERVGRRVAAAQIRALGQADASGVAASTGAVSTAAWLRSVTQVPAGVGKARLELRRVLGNWPATAAAFAIGDIRPDAASTVCSALAGLPAGVPASLTAEVEGLLVGVARDDGLRAVVQRAAEITHRFAPDALEAAEETQVAQRRLTVTHQHDGTIALRGCFDREAGALVWSVLGALAAPAPATDGVPDLRDAPTRYGDALVRVCQIASASSQTPTVRGERPTVVVTIGLGALQGQLDQPPGLLETGAPLSAGAARRLACDARIIPIVLGSGSEPLDVGRAAYVVPQPMRRALVARDGGCAFPGCDRPAAWTDAHHIRHWADGGDTAIGNLVMVCGRHHRAVHHDGWQISLDDHGRPWFTPPAWLDASRQPRQHHRYRVAELDP